MDPEVATTFIECCLREFRDREFPPNMPIYAFDLVDIDQKNGDQAFGLACIADTEGELYIHNPNNRYAKDNPDLYFEKGDIKRRADYIARSVAPLINPRTGKPKPVGKITGLDSVRDVITDSIKYQVIVDDHLMELYTESIAARLNMSPKERAYIEQHERQGNFANALSLLDKFTEAVEASNKAILERKLEASFE